MHHCKCEERKEPCNRKVYEDREVSYYEVKKHNNCKKCKGNIEKTEKIIDEIECKSHKVTHDLVVAENNLKHVNPGFIDITKKVNILAMELGKMAKILQESQNLLGCIIKELENIDPKQAIATQAVDNALNNQEDINEMLDYLEETVQETVCCLKQKDSEFPILIPVEKEGHGHHKEPGCGCHKEHGQVKPKGHGCGCHREYEYYHHNHYNCGCHKN